MTQSISQTQWCTVLHLLIGVLWGEEKDHLLPVVLDNGLGQLQGQVVAPSTKCYSDNTNRQELHYF